MWHMRTWLRGEHSAGLMVGIVILILNFALATKPGHLGQSKRKIRGRNKSDFEKSRGDEPHHALNVCQLAI